MEPQACNFLLPIVINLCRMGTPDQQAYDVNYALKPMYAKAVVLNLSKATTL